MIIPTGSPEQDIERTKRALKEYEKNEGSYFVISGTLGDKKLPKSQTANIYRELRNHGVKSSQISIEKESRNSIENIVKSLEKIKKRGGKEVGIVSYPGHLDRFKDIFERAQKEGVVDEDFKLYRLPTRTRKNETRRERLYEVLSGILHKYKLRHGVKEALKSEDKFYFKYPKTIVNYILNPVKNIKKLFS